MSDDTALPPADPPLGVQLRGREGHPDRDVAVTLDGWLRGAWHWVADLTDEEVADVLAGRAAVHVAELPGLTALVLPYPWPG